MNFFMQYDVIIIGAGPGGIFSAYELSKLCPEKKIAVFEEGQPLEKRKCPIDGKTVKHCVGCPTCAIMNGFGGAGAFSDGKYNLTNDFGGTLYEYIGKKQAMELMHYVDAINVSHGGENTAWDRRRRSRSATIPARSQPSSSARTRAFPRICSRARSSRD